MSNSEAPTAALVRTLKDVDPKVIYKRDPEWPGHVEAWVELGSINNEAYEPVVTFHADFGNGNVRRIDSIPRIRTYNEADFAGVNQARSIKIGASVLGTQFAFALTEGRSPVGQLGNGVGWPASIPDKAKPYIYIAQVKWRTEIGGDTVATFNGQGRLESYRAEKVPGIDLAKTVSRSKLGLI